MRWSILAGACLWPCLLARSTPARADEPLHTCAKVAPGAKLTIQFTPDLTLRDLGAWVSGFTCKSVVYDAEAAARATKLALIAPSAVTPKQAVQLFADTLQKAGLAVAEKPDVFVVSLAASTQRRCPAPPSATRPSLGAAACKQMPADTRLAVTFQPDVTLDDLVLWLAGFSCKRVSFDPSIATRSTTVSLIVPAKVSPKQATRLFVDAVESTGLAVAEKAGGFEVTPGPRWSHCASAARAPAAGPPASGPPAATGRPTPPVSPPAPDVDADVDVDAVLDAGIRKLDDTHYELKRAALDAALLNPMALAKGARIVPAMKNGRPDGFKLYAVRVGSIFARLGLANGDTLQTVNGHRMDSPDQALEVYTKLRDATQLDLGLVRQGAPLTITIKIVK